MRAGVDFTHERARGHFHACMTNEEPLKGRVSGVTLPLEPPLLELIPNGGESIGGHEIMRLVESEIPSHWALSIARTSCSAQACTRLGPTSVRLQHLPNHESPLCPDLFLSLWGDAGFVSRRSVPPAGNQASRNFPKLRPLPPEASASSWRWRERR